MNLRIIALTLFVSTVVGCAAPQISLTQQVQTNIDQVQGILTIPQNNLNVTVQATNPGNSGLIGALVVMAIDSARQSRAEGAATPVLETLRDYDFRVVMLNATNEALAKIDKLKVVIPVRVETIASDSARRISFDESSASAILFCNVGYRLEAGNLMVAAVAEMYPKKAALKQFRNKPEETNPLEAGNVIYRKTFAFTKQAIAASNIKASLNEAATSIASQLAADLNHGI